MHAITFRAQVARKLSIARDNSVVLAAFSGTLLLSALLLFSVQPIFAKMVLPKLGGSPSVWAVSMCFFQAVLLAGYCYAHALNRFLPSRHAPVAHLILCGLAMLALPFGLPAGAEPPAGDAYLWLIGVLALGVGLPFFAVSANAPLLQAWFARTGHPHGADPYFLYGASNLGSLVALLAYPIIIEPSLGLAVQSGAWTSGFVMLALMIAICALLMLLAVKDAGGEAAAQENHVPAAPVAWRQRLIWIGLAFVPSGLLVAFTSYLTTDIASAPFLWVIPLAVFLATFVLVFRDRLIIPHRLLLLAQPFLATIVLLGLSISGNTGWVMGVTAGFAAFFVTTMVCHRELYEQRPESRHLTEFYLWMSLGGVLGGIFAALIAPQVFNTLYEFPLLLMLGMLCRPGLAAALQDEAEVEQAGLVGAAQLAAIVALAVGIWTEAIPSVLANGAVILVILAGGVLTLTNVGRPLRAACCAAAMGLGLVALPSAMSKGFSERSFFGVHRVMMIANGEVRLLVHGTTIHGAERIKDEQGRGIANALPATYYYPGSPMARGTEVAREVSANPRGGLNVGIVGLGAGSMACYSRPNEAWRFYEIDPIVVKLASNPKLFSFLSRCRPNADIVLGDARLTLAREPAGRFDYVVIDAFSSDSIPVHLLTREALLLFLDKLAPNGLLALHISNRHLDLASVVGALARSVPGLHAAIAHHRPKPYGVDRAASVVMFIAKSPDTLNPVLAWNDVTPVEKAEAAVWTDDYSDILSALWRHYVR